MPDDLLAKLACSAGSDKLEELRNERLIWLKRDSVEKFHAVTYKIPGRKVRFDFSGPEVIIGDRTDLTDIEQHSLDTLLDTFVPWRKGPFAIFGRKIDAEWQSNLKFDRILPHLDDPNGKIYADVGANNGYYMFRLANLNPAGIIGFEPTIRHKILFDFLQGFTQLPNLQFELLGGEHMVYLEKIFDCVLCLGVVYHHPDPIGMLRGIWNSIKPNGQLIVESQGIPGDDSYCLFPEKRYGKAPGIWFIPTESALINWISRSGFKDVEVFYKHPMSSHEQRQTRWMQYESYSDYLDPDDASRTIEGYPAPWRFYIKARKRNN